MATVQALTAREIQDSRGTPTIEVTLQTAHGTGVASVPSGASVGVHEALELRDGDQAAHGGRGVLHAIAHIHDTIAPAVICKELDQRTLDTLLCELDGTPNKARLGANAILGVSIAFARAAAQEQNFPLYAYIGSLDNRTSFTLPEPLFNVLNGGKHAKHGIDIQECMLAPIGIESIAEKVRVASQCVALLKAELEQRNLSTDTGDEGGFAPALGNNTDALDLLVHAITQSGNTTDTVRIALDVAASSFYKDGVYTLHKSGTEQAFSHDQLLALYTSLVDAYPIISIEDGFAEDDWSGFSAMTKALGERIRIVGDDLTVTNSTRITEAIDKKAANACIIKPNQVGTISETLDAVHTARAAGWKVFASHRSGETMDTFIADLATGLSCDYIKAGAPTRPERLAKYTRLIEIENELHTI